MNKALLVIVITLLSMFFISSVQMCSAEPTISVEPSYLTVSPGESFTVNITVDPDGAEIAGGGYILYFDNAVLKALSQSQGPFLGGNIVANDIYNSNGSLDYGEWKIGSATDSGVLTTIEFEAISTGISELHFESAILSDPGAIEISGVWVNDGTCNIESAGQTPTATPTQTSGGSGDNGRRSASHTQNPIPTSTPLPTQTAGLTSTPTLTATSLPSASPTTATSQNPGASTSQSEEKSNKLPGFGASFAITGLVMIAHLILKEKRWK
ncbi:MAG: cohesin domain-containing protein [Euryarchaeota archaeon]|nr:cohesin domain-containing protein [Euryarchaeota archaeon]